MFGSTMRSSVVAVGLLLLFLLQPVAAQEVSEESPEEPGAVTVLIVEPFIELHTGPAASYPVTQVIDRGSRLFVIRQFTDWFRVEDRKGTSGWVSREALQKTTLPDGSPFRLREYGADDFSQRNWTLGVATGEFQSVPVYTLFAAWSPQQNLAAEFSWSNSVGNISSSTFYKGSLMMFPFGDLAYSPFLSLGVGEISVKPGANLVALAEKTSRFAQLGVGLQAYVSRRFMVRIEANEYTLFSASSDNDDNEEVDEWKIGFAVFF